MISSYRVCSESTIRTILRFLYFNITITCVICKIPNRITCKIHCKSFPPLLGAAFLFCTNLPCNFCAVRKIFAYANICIDIFAYASYNILVAIHRQRNATNPPSERGRRTVLYSSHLYNTTILAFCQGLTTKYTRKDVSVIALANYKLFRAEIRKQMDLRDWKYKDLAKASGYSVASIEGFMGGYRVNDRVAGAIAKALDIPAHMAT